MESYKIIRQVLQNLPDGPISVRAPRKIPAGESVSSYEAPRGEDIHYVKSNGTEYPERVKVRAPTLANIQTVKHMLKDHHLADIPIVVAAIDPCFSCTHRTLSIKHDDRRDVETITWETLREYSIAWYLKRGIDMSIPGKVLHEMMEHR